MKSLKKLFKNSVAFVLVLCMVAPMSVFAATGTYNSTYDFTGGLYSTYLNMNSNRNVTVYTYPDLQKTYSGATKISLELWKKGFWGDSLIDNSWNYARQNDSAVLTTKDSGDHRIYYYAVTTGYRHAGDTTIKY
jgi:hypothetical protein